MIRVPGGGRLYLAMGRTDLRKGCEGLALQVQEVLTKDPSAGHLFRFSASAASAAVAVTA